MSRRAIFRAVLLASAVSVPGVVRAQAPETPLRRLDERTLGLPAAQRQAPARAPAQPLAGGEYGAEQTQATPLAGGDYGAPPADAEADPYASADPANPPAPGEGDPSEAAPPAPIAPSLLADPLAAGPGGFRRQRFAPIQTPVDEAYAAPGLKAGSFTLRPSLESAGGYDTNPNRVDDGAKGAGFARLRGAFDATSDWSRHALDFQSSAQIRKYESVRKGYEPDVNAALTGRLDVTDRTQVNAQIRGSIIASQPGDPETSGVEGDEISRSVGATLGVAHRFNRLSLRLDGLADRYTVRDSKLSQPDPLTGDDVRDNADRAYNSYQARLRASYDLSPKLAPFVEGSIDTRDYDRRFDNSGTRRLGSDGYSLRGGAQFELGRLIAGELGLGYGRQTPKENGLEPVDGLLIDGNVAWTATPLTTIRMTARTSLQESSLVNASGILDRVFELAVEHQFRRYFSATARLAFERADYKGAGLRQDSITAGLAGEYRLSRTLSLIGSFEQVWLDSTARNDDYVASIIEFGLKVRR